MKIYRSKKKTLDRLWMRDAEDGVFTSVRNTKAGKKIVKKFVNCELEDLTKEEFLEQKEFEERLMKEMFSRPVEVQLGGKSEFINHIAKKAVELYEGVENDKR